MTRPFAGQRNFGTTLFASASFAASLSSASAGATTLALGSGSASFGAAEATIAFCGAGLGAAAAFTAGAGTPGMMRRSPTLRVAVGWMLLALAISLIDLWKRCEILLSVSPAPTT